MPEPIKMDSVFVDFATRFQSTQTVAASPTDATETIIATLTLSNFGDIQVTTGIRLHGWAAFTVGTNGVSANLRIRQTDVNGSVVVATGATTVTAANLVVREAIGKDATPGKVTYVLTLAVGSASAGSTVSACHLGAIII